MDRVKGKKARVAGVAVGAFAVLTSVLVVPGAMAGNTADEEVGAADKLAEEIEWVECDEESLAPVPEEERKLYTCADQQVPLDHADPEGEQISIALMRRAVEQPARKIGTLVTANGGPGMPGRPLAASIGAFVDDSVLTAFDVIGFDQRGLGGSSTVDCFTNPEDALEVAKGLNPVPITDDEVSGTLGAYGKYGEACEKNAAAVQQHMSTKDAAQDVEWLRAGLGEDQLSFLGISYGTLVGATYANMYPDRVRAMVLDSAVDPELRTTDGLQQDRERAAGHEASLKAFLEECEKAGDACAFSSGDPKKKFDELRDHLRKQPIELPDGTPMDIGSFTSGVADSLLASAELSGLATELQAAYEVINPAAGSGTGTTVKSFERLGKTGNGTVSQERSAAAGATPYADEEENPLAFYDGHFSINCSDKPFTHDQGDVPGIVAEWEKESPTFARYQAFAEASACPVWPTKSPDRYEGPWDKKTEAPVLVIGGLHDPATPYAFAERMTEQLGNARLLTIDGFGHFFAGLSQDADSAISTYLTGLRPPAEGKTVELDDPPFSN